MSDINENFPDTTPEHKFARDLIRFVLKEKMLGLHWIPTDIFAKEDIDSPFTAEYKVVFSKELDYDGHDLHLLYDVDFPDKSLVEIKHYSVCWNLKYEYMKCKFDKIQFIKFCAKLAGYAGLSYLYGAKKAPLEAYLLILMCLRELKLLKKIDDTFLYALQNCLAETEELEETDDQNVIEDISEESCENGNII